MNIIYQTDACVVSVTGDGRVSFSVGDLASCVALDAWDAIEAAERILEQRDRLLDMYEASEVRRAESRVSGVNS